MLPLFEVRSGAPLRGYFVTALDPQGPSGQFLSWRMYPSNAPGPGVTLVHRTSSRSWGLGRDFPGYLNAGGHFRTGTVTSPLTGLLIAELIAGEDPSFPMDPFLFSRFSSAAGVERVSWPVPFFGVTGSGEVSRKPLHRVTRQRRMQRNLLLPKSVSVTSLTSHERDRG